MSTPFAPVAADGKALLVQGVTAVKTLVDSLLGDSSEAIPKVTGDVLTAAVTYLESILPGNIAGIVSLVLTAGEAAAAPALAALDVKGQVAIALVQKDADTFLESVMT